MFPRASDNPSGLYTPACALSQTPAERHAALTEAQTRSSSTQLPSQVARPPATLTYFFIFLFTLNQEISLAFYHRLYCCYTASLSHQTPPLGVAVQR